MLRTFKLLMAVLATLLVSAGLGLSGALAAVPAAQIAGDGVLVRSDDDENDDDVIDPNGPIFSKPGKIDNAYLPITAFERCEMRGTETTDEGTAEKVAVKKLLDRTKEFEVNGQDVEAVVIRDKSWLDGELIENTLDYFAQADDGTVYYLGEDAKHFEDGEFVGNEGSWHFGRDTDVIGVAMPASPQVGDTWMTEDVPDVGTESNEMTEHLDTATAGGTTYTDVIKVHGFVTPDNEDEDKLYARDVGVVEEAAADGATDLVSCDEEDD